jgi:putative hydrolase of the HAD superfamily
MNDARPSLFVFDAVGTLIRPVEPVAASYQRFGQQWGSGLDEDEIGRRFRIHMPRIFDARPEWHSSEAQERDRWRRLVETIFTDLPQSGILFERLWEYYGLPSSWELYDDVPVTIEWLMNRGCPFAIASNFDSRLISICQGIKLLADAGNVFCSSGIGFMKPAAEFYATVARRSGCLPHQLVMIGDNREADVLGARRAGWRAVLLDRRQGTLIEHIRLAFPGLENDRHPRNS